MAPNSAKHASTSDVALTTTDDVVSFIRSFEDGGGGEGVEVSSRIRDSLLPGLNRAAAAQGKGRGGTLFTSQLQGGIEPLEMLDPKANTLGYTFILASRSNAAEEEGQAHVLMPHIARFAQGLTAEQWRGAGEIVTSLVHGVVGVSRLVNDLVWAVPSLLRVLDAFRTANSSESNLTTIHTAVLYHLLRTAHYSTAVDWILRHDVVTADVSISPLSYTDVLEYFYYAGLTYTKLDQYEQACLMFEQCVCSPAQTISAIQMDAYKKMILVQLLHFGKISPLPSQTSSSIQRSIRGRVSNIEVYNVLSRAVSHEPVLHFGRQIDSQDDSDVGTKGAWSEVDKAVLAGYDTFVRDQNLGLVKRLARQHFRRRLHRLSNHFVRISLKDIATLLDVQRQDRQVSQAEAQHIYDELSAAQQAGWLVFKTEGVGDAVTTATIIRFEEAEVDFTSVQAAHRLIAVTGQSRRWNGLVHDKERALASSEAYLSKILQPGRDRSFFPGGEDFEDGE